MGNPLVARWWLALFAVGLVAVTGAVAGASVVDVDLASDDGDDARELLNETADRYADAESVVGEAVVTVENDTASANATVAFAVADNGTRVAVTRGNETYRVGTNGTVAWYADADRAVAWAVDGFENGTLPAADGEGPAMAGLDAPATLGNYSTAGNYSSATSDRNGTALRALLAEMATAPERAAADGEPRAGNASWESLSEDREWDSNVSVEVVESTTADGTPARVLRVTPENATEEWNATLWVARDDARVLRAEAADGNASVRVDVRSTQFNVSVHESEFAPPSDRVSVSSIERYGAFDPAQANTSLNLPTLDAPVESVVVATRASETVAAQQYRPDAANVTILSTTADGPVDRVDATEENVTVAGQSATMAATDDRTVVYWRTDGVTTAVVVDGGEDPALAFARRIAE